MAQLRMSHSEASAARTPWRSAAPADEARLSDLVLTHWAFVWRMLRRLGIGSGDADDAAQQVFLIASRKLSSIEAGRERSFLFGTTVRVAAGARRKREHRREVPDEDVLKDLADPNPAPDELLQLRRARELLDAILDAMQTELVAVFVLFEVERMTTSEIADLLDLPSGTVASRLRRARAEFEMRLTRIRARSRPQGGAA